MVMRYVEALVRYARRGGVRRYLGAGLALARGAYSPPLPLQPLIYESQGPALAATPALKLVAFYLPQFHPIPENDAWWGEGFTEWVNVARAKPLFPGHVQPDWPGDLGQYDLRQPEVMRRQIALAKWHGVHGFCFHYYWFSGKRLLEGPLELFLQDKSLDFPFCLNWANENWSRRWDGSNDVLLKQHHSAEDDIAVMRDIMRYFADPRYIRIEGRPVLLIYRKSLFPDMAATLARWRDVCHQNGEEPPFTIMVQSFGSYDPCTDGFDAAVQFPPHLAYGKGGYACRRVAGQNPAFRGMLHDYASLAERSLAGLQAPFPTLPCVCPGWDNTPRRGLTATLFVNPTPERYAAWLRKACEHTCTAFPESRRFVFVNAWNEWAEGTHLEPSAAHGYAHLNATTQVLANFSCVESGESM